MNTSRLSAQVCSTLSPPPAEVTPKANPDSPTATPTPSASRTTAASGLRQACRRRAVRARPSRADPARLAAGVVCSATPGTVRGRRRAPGLVRSCASALVGAGRYADDPGEVPVQVRLVGEADGDGRLGGRRAGVQEAAGRRTRASVSQVCGGIPYASRKARSRANGLVPSSAASCSRDGGAAIRSASTARARAAIAAPGGRSGARRAAGRRAGAAAGRRRRAAGCRRRARCPPRRPGAPRGSGRAACGSSTTGRGESGGAAQRAWSRRRSPRRDRRTG